MVNLVEHDRTTRSKRGVAARGSRDLLVGHHRAVDVARQGTRGVDERVVEHDAGVGHRSGDLELEMFARHHHDDALDGAVGKQRMGQARGKAGLAGAGGRHDERVGRACGVPRREGVALPRAQRQMPVRKSRSGHERRRFCAAGRVPGTLHRAKLCATKSRMEVSRALADLEEVHSRLIAVQRFRGWSGGAAILSGTSAFAIGAYQFFTLPYPASTIDAARFVTMWIACLIFALVINYGAIVLWLARNWTLRARCELRTVGMTIAPAIALGGILTVALLNRHLDGMLPGVWCVCYAMGLVASRAMVPRGVLAVAALFGTAGTALLFAADLGALRWWVMPATFGVGQLVIGALVLRDDLRYGHG